MMIRAFVGSVVPFVGLMAVTAPVPVIAQDATLPVESERSGLDVRLATAMNAFAKELHAQLREPNTDRPLAWSPASAASALLMLVPGARGETLGELARGLHLPDDLRGDALVTAAVLLRARLFADSADCLQMHSDLWLQSGLSVTPDYRSTIRRAFGAAVRPVDFAADPASAAHAINTAIGRATNQRLGDLVSAEGVQDARQLVVSAVRVRGRWAWPLYRQEKPMQFHVAADRTVEVPMIGEGGQFVYAEGDAWQAVRLNLSGARVALELVLPRAGQPLTVAEAVVFDDALSRSGKRQDVRLTLPVFEVGCARDLSSAACRIGLRAPFAEQADFSGIAPGHARPLDGLPHRAWIRVDEHGLEAAAATGGPITAGPAGPGVIPPVFCADRPFVFAVRHLETGLLLFVGRVVDPSRGR